MCNRYVSPDEAAIERQWRLDRRTPWRGAEVFPRKPGAFIRLGLDGAIELVEGRWGIVPPYHRKPLQDFKLSTNNARWEDKVRISPTFKPAWAKAQRCIIPAVSFTEPNWESGAHVPWRFARADGQLLGLAGLWHTWRSPTGELLETYTMITISADTHPLMRRMHKPDPKLGPDDQDKRMVAVLEDDQQDAWLRAPPAEAEPLVSQWPAERFSAGPIVAAAAGKPISVDPTTGELF